MSVSAPRAVVVTRAEGADGPLSVHLRELGLEVLHWPVVSVDASPDDSLQRALGRVEEFDWIVFTSRNAVAAVTASLPTAPARVRIAAVGEATARALREQGWQTHLVPEEANAAALVAAFARVGCAGARILFPASSRALPTLPRGLTALGARVEQVEAYRTQGAPLDVEACRGWIARDGIAAVTFTSPSAVVELERGLGERDFRRLLSRSPAVALGATTGRALHAHGCTPVIAEPPTLQGLALTTLKLIQTRQ